MSNNLINIKIPKYNLNYQIDNKKNIIESSLDKNIKLAYSCKSGICGTCKAKIISGELNKNNKINHILSESEKENNIVLLCQATAKSSEIELEPLSPLPRKVEKSIVREFISEVLSIKEINNNTMELYISVPKRFVYENKRNNYVEVLIPGKKNNEKYYIFVECEENNINNGTVKIIINKSEDLEVRKYIQANLIHGETITIKGPFQENIPEIPYNKPLLFLVENNYIINSLNLIKNLILMKIDVPIMLISSFTSKNEIILLDEMHKLQFLYNNFSYKITLLNNKDSNNINRFQFGKTINIINKVFPDLSSHYIFIYGENKFIEENYNKVIELGAIKNNINKL